MLADNFFNRVVSLRTHIYQWNCRFDSLNGKFTIGEAHAVLELDPMKQIEFERAVMADDAQLQQAYLADIQNARARDVKLAKVWMKNTWANALAATAILLVMVCLFTVV
jgi:hypothetical protein